MIRFASRASTVAKLLGSAKSRVRSTSWDWLYTSTRVEWYTGYGVRGRKMANSIFPSSTLLK